MSLLKCSGCGERKPGKYANTTIAWWNESNRRLAYRMRLCKDCYGEAINDVQIAVHENEFSCPYCHTEPGDDMDPTYITVFIPNYGKLQLECATCGNDAVILRSFAVEKGELLPDVEVGGQGPSPQTPPQDWDAFLGKTRFSGAS